MKWSGTTGSFGKGDDSLQLMEPTHPFQVGDIVIIKKLKKGKFSGDFPYGPPTTVVAATRTAVLTEEAPTWIHATRVKLVKEAPQKEVLTGADSSDLEEGQSKVVTGADSSDLEKGQSEVLTGADSSDLHQDALPQFWKMAQMVHLDCGITDDPNDSAGG
ncbi:uncharacterized protein LOC122929688 isoform X2 [Bufo gargarizans]|uniref:uncharacterized protein LOC122929688 isoform X2 n=1 Tax=Bufo gargarizans TaxID=30331 RepID=UPI001CF1F83B|nr:uncharacterized protein LOC122929688 isoform X2 [Bufo gargarizans]